MQASRIFMALATAAILTAGQAFAQSDASTETEATTEPTATESSEGEAPSADAPETEAPQPTEIQVGQTYIDSEFGDWELRCVKTEDGNDPCQLYQLLADASGNPVSEITVFGVDPGQRAAAGATIITPLETLLTRGLQVAVDGGEAKTYAFSFCREVGCFARIGLEQAEVDAFKRGAVATVRMVPAAAPDQDVILEISLTGFTAAFNALGGS